MATTIYNFQQEFCESLTRILTTARAHEAARAVFLSTRDRDFALQTLREVAVGTQVPLHHFTVAYRRQFRPERQSFESTNVSSPDPYELLSSAGQTRGAAIVVFEDFLRFVADANGDPRSRAQLGFMLSHENRCGGHLYVFMESPEAEASIPSSLRNQFQHLSLPLPRAEELEFIAREEIVSAFARRRQPVDTARTREWAEVIASELPGLTQFGARNALRDALGSNLDLQTAREILARRKAQQLSHELSMDILDTQNVLPPIGLDYVYRFFEVQRPRIAIPGTNRCKGILLVGLPGTGKSMFARYIGSLLGVNAVEFRIASLMNSYVGATEQAFERAFAVFEAMAPSVIFIDELEKIFGDQGGERDGGTMMRATGRVLSWMSDSEAPNFIVATANSVTRMGEIGQTMTRKGRIDRLFFVDVPCRSARIKILERVLKDRMEVATDELGRLADLTDRFSGADLSAVVEDAVAEARYEKQVLTSKYLEREIERNRLRAQHMYEEFNPLRRWAQQHCEPAGPSE